VPCWSLEPLIGFSLKSVLEPVCAAEPLVPHSSIDPSEPDRALGEGATFGGALGVSCASALGGFDSFGVPGAVVPCWSFEPLIGFPLRSVLEPVCGAELFAPQSPISPLEPDMGGGAGSAAAGKMSNASKKKVVTSRQTHLRDPREAKRRIIHPAEGRPRLLLIK